MRPSGRPAESIITGQNVTCSVCLFCMKIRQAIAPPHFLPTINIGIIGVAEKHRTTGQYVLAGMVLSRFEVQAIRRTSTAANTPPNRRMAKLRTPSASTRNPLHPGGHTLQFRMFLAARPQDGSLGRIR